MATPNFAARRLTYHILALVLALAPVAARADGPAGVTELVLEVDDVAAERDRVVAAGWPLEEDLRRRPWGLTDFRVLDPAGYYLRITPEPRRAD